MGPAVTHTETYSKMIPVDVARVAVDSARRAAEITKATEHAALMQAVAYEHRTKKELARLVALRESQIVHLSVALRETITELQERVRELEGDVAYRDKLLRSAEVEAS